MPDTPDIAAIRDTLQFVVASDIPAQHKRILLDAITQALRAAEAVEHRVGTQQKISENWDTDEAQAVETFLRGKVAISWQHADEVLMRLAGELHRTPADVRTKATELGLGAAVDYALAKAGRVHSPDM
jgi:hypothetical protein